jgi:hypothetical protein
MEVDLIDDKQIRIAASGLDRGELQRLLDLAVVSMEDFWTLKQTQQKRFLLARINQESLRLEQAQGSPAEVTAEARVRLEGDRAMLRYLEQSPPTLQATSPSFSTSRKAPPDNLLLLAVALLLIGLAATTMVAFLVEISGPELVTERQIARVLQLPVYGKLPLNDSLATGQILK